MRTPRAEHGRVLTADRSAADATVMRTFTYPIRLDAVIAEQLRLFQHLATLVKAGISVEQALALNETRRDLPWIGPVSQQVRARISQGETLGDAMAAYPEAFTELQVAMVRAGEYGGTLDRVLEHLAESLEEEIRLRNFLRLHTLYPKILLFSAFIAVPSGISLIMGADPGSVLISDIVVAERFVVWAMMLCAAYAMARRALANSADLRLRYARFKWSLPVAGDAVRRFAFARFARSLGMIHSSGVPLSLGVELSLRASGSEILAELAPNVMRRLSDGVSLAQALGACGVFPDEIVQQIHTGELAGDLDPILVRAANEMRDQAEGRAYVAAYLLATLVLLLVALIVFGPVFLLGLGMLSSHTG